MKQEGFTLLELLIVIIILATLAVLGVQKYGLVQERMRTGEAKQILAQIRKAQKAYYLEKGAYGAAIYATDLNQLRIDAPYGCTNSGYYFQYWVNNNARRAVASRCTNAQSKQPASTEQYYIFLYYDTYSGASCNYGGATFTDGQFGTCNAAHERYL